MIFKGYLHFFHNFFEKVKLGKFWLFSVENCKPAPQIHWLIIEVWNNNFDKFFRLILILNLKCLFLYKLCFSWN